MKSIAIFLVRAQRAFSPIWRMLLGTPGPCCRFHPTCSQYAEEAIRQHGLVRGGGMALGRLIRCHPWGGVGHDPVRRVS